MLEPGAEIAGYRIERLLGRGGMGEVYEAVQVGLGRRVAFKILHAGLIGDEDFRDRFRREGRLQATLEHPNVITVYEAGEIDEGLFLAMRLIDGPTLKKLVGGTGMEPERAVRLLAPVADALDTAHENGLVHRDVKPQNILVGKGEVPFLADFGLTRGRDQTAFTRSGQMIGTVDYISPEQVEGGEAGPGSDVYALGAVLYECLTGAVPYDLSSDAAVLYAHVHTGPPDPADARPGLPPGMSAAVAAGMAKDPEARPASAGQLLADAAASLGGDAGSSAGDGRRSGGGNARQAGTTKASATTTPARDTASAPTRVLSSRRYLVPVLGVAAAIALAALALAVGRAVGGSSAPKLTTAVAGPTVGFRAPGSWEPTASADRLAIPGLDLRGAVGAAPAQTNGTGASAGTTDAVGARLLPAAFLGRVEGELPAADPVDLGELEALRYEGVKLRGFDRELTVYAAPSTAGAATLACYSLPGGQSLGETCGSIATTLSLTSGQPLPLAPPAAVAHEVSAAVTALNRARRSGRRQLRAAKTTAEEAAAASALARSYASFATRLGGLEPGPILAGEVAAAQSAANAAAADYRRLATAARGQDAAEYARATAGVKSSEAKVEAALARLGGQG